MQKLKEQLPSSLKYFGLPFYVFLKETFYMFKRVLYVICELYKTINKYIADPFQFRISSIFR